jgi:predicted MFS family arabinose efflux permease
MQRTLLSTAAPAGAAIGAILLDHIHVTAIIAASTLACTVAGSIVLSRRDIRSRIDPK